VGAEGRAKSQNPKSQIPKFATKPPRMGESSVGLWKARYGVRRLCPFGAQKCARARLALVGGIAHAGDAAFPVGGAAPGDGGILGGACLASGEKGGEREGEEGENELFHGVRRAWRLKNAG